MELLKWIKEYWFRLSICAIIIFFLSFLIISALDNFPEKDFLIIKSLTSIFLAIGVIYAARQFHLNQKQLNINNKWNRQQLGMTEISKANEKLESIIRDLKEEFDYAEREEPYKLSEIHDKFGKFIEDGKSFEFDKNGKEIKSKIIELLNTFEYIATGVNLGIFDEEVVRRLIRGKLVYAFKMFESYINHLRTEHHWTNVYTELETLARRWA